jgi:nucleoside-diphosphate-sugar epimerase
MTQQISNKDDILIVGADGYIGSNRFLQTDRQVFCIDKKTGKDFLDVKPQKYGTIVFLAADLANTDEAFAYNQKLYKHLDKWLKAFPNTHVIYTSSAAVYPDSPDPHKEDESVAPPTRYGDSKLLGEYHVREYKRHTILRLSNVTGSRPNGRKGAGVRDSFLDGSRVIYGNGSQIRDFVNVGTVWAVIDSAISYPQAWAGVTNISTGRGQRILDVFHGINGASDPIFEPTRPGDVKCSILDNTKMMETLAKC